MSEIQQGIINELLKVIKDSEACEGMPFSTSKELISLVRQLQVS
jgi:hypothetical protein